MTLFKRCFNEQSSPGARRYTSDAASDEDREEELENLTVPNPLRRLCVSEFVPDPDDLAPNIKRCC